MHPPVLVLRTAPAPPPPPRGRLLDDLRATQAHAATTRWLRVSDLVVRERLPDEVRAAWSNGRGPGGLRTGIAFVEGDRPFLPHPAPGALSATCGLTGDTLTPWLRGFVLALAGARAVVQLDGERFSLEPRLDGHLRLRAIDPDGVEEARLIFDRAPLLAALRAEVNAIPALLDAARDLGEPLPAADLEEAVRTLHGLDARG